MRPAVRRRRRLMSATQTNAPARTSSFTVDFTDAAGPACDQGVAAVKAEMAASVGLSECSCVPLRSDYTALFKHNGRGRGAVAERTRRVLPTAFPQRECAQIRVQLCVISLTGSGGQSLRNDA